MVKLKGGSPIFSTMDTSRRQLARGNKLFLPKIEYAKLTEARSFNGERPNIQTTISGGEKSSGEFDNAEKAPLLNNSYNTGSFTRFSVLPPIKDSVLNARRISRTRKFSSVNGPSPASSNELTNKRGDDYGSHKYAGFSSAAAQQRRDLNADNDVQNLQVVGKPYARGKRKPRHSGQGKSNARSPRRSFSSPMPSESSDSNCEGCQALLARERSKTEISGQEERLKVDGIVHTCNKKEALPGHALRRFNSENFDLLNEKRVYEHNEINQPSRGRKETSTLISRPELRTNLLTADFPAWGGRRPVSRCEISVDVNEGEQQIQMATDQERHKVRDQQQNVAPPFIQIDHAETDSNGLTPKDEVTLHSQGTPQIQILIDSLDSAKDELPKPGREVPYTSVREQRRRSALCRNNSKQVDDFLLVHNLRDLGLL